MHNLKRISFIPKDTALTGFYWMKTDFARSEATRCPEQSRREAISQKQPECQIN